MSKIQTPDYNYLSQKIGVESGLELKNQILEHCEKINMGEMVSDVAPFLFSEKDQNKVLFFKDFIKQQSLYRKKGTRSDSLFETKTIKSLFCV